MISENKKIMIAISFVLLFILSSLIAYEKIIDPSHTHDRQRDENLLLNGYLSGQDFFDSDFSDTKTMFLIGSSHLGSANVTSINKMVNLTNQNSSLPITIYNLAMYGDSPSKRLDSIEEIISTSPEIIFYQLSYRDFQFTYDDEKFAIPINFKELLFLQLHLVLIDHIPVNPQELLFSILKPIQNSIVPSLEKSIVTNDKTPFFHYTKFTIKSKDGLKNELPSVINWEDPKIADENIHALKQILEISQKNNVKVVIFTSPLHEYYLQDLSEKQKNNFSNLLEKLKVEYDLKIYDFQDNYHGLDVWQDKDHISYNNLITIYNEDIAKMIIEET